MSHEVVQTDSRGHNGIRDCVNALGTDVIGHVCVF
jgi:peptidyl-tRNA hydrolase